ncbi:MAG: serine hydrolase [Wenzhouxiangella sp.]|nr:serine hydrolase [Wenzhouxiangella sp.]
MRWITGLTMAMSLLWFAAMAQAQPLTTVRVGDIRLDRTAPSVFSYADGEQFTIVSFAPSGLGSGPVTTVALSLADPGSSTSACDEQHFEDFTPGHVALIQRGGCAFSVKVINAEAAGASAVLLFDQGLENNFALPGFSLGESFAGTIPVLATSFAWGEFFAGIEGLAFTIETRLFSGTRPLALLRYCEGNPDHCALSVRHVNGGWERHLNPHRLHSTASTYKTLMLLAYAEAVVEGDLNPSTLVDKEDWARFSMRSDGGALASAWNRLGNPDEVSIDQMVSVMMRESDNAAPDWLLNALGEAALEQVVDQYIEGYHDLPISINALFQFFQGMTTEPGPAGRIIGSYDSLLNPGWRDELNALFSGPMQTEAWMQAQRDFICVALPWETLPGPCAFGGQNSLEERRTILGRYFSRTNSRTMLELMTALLKRDLLDPDAQTIAEPHMEWPMTLAGIGDRFSRYGAKGGSFGPQNICNMTAYLETADTGDQVAVAVFIHESLHSCNQGLFPFDFIEAFAEDAAFRELLRTDPMFDRIFVDRFAAP